jgi:hypothetical protein
MTLGNFYTDLESKQPCLTKYSHEEGESTVAVLGITSGDKRKEVAAGVVAEQVDNNGAT